MRTTPIIAILLMYVLLILSACVRPATTTQPALAIVPAPLATTTLPSTPAVIFTPAPLATTTLPSTPAVTFTPAPPATTALTPALAPATGLAFVTSNLTLSTPYCNLDETVSVSVTVTNIGELTGTYPVILKVGSDFLPSQNYTLNEYVTLAGGASRNVTFYITPIIDGSVKVTIDKLSAYLTVI